MTQIVSSAIVKYVSLSLSCQLQWFMSKDSPSNQCTLYVTVTNSAPPPGAIISTLHKASKTYVLNEYTSEEMTEIFHNDVNGEELQHKKLLNRRNWCEVRELSGMELEFTLHVEKLDHVGSEKYPVLV